jgi:hypothetical protein
MDSTAHDYLRHNSYHSGKKEDIREHLVNCEFLPFFLCVHFTPCHIIGFCVKNEWGKVASCSLSLNCDALTGDRGRDTLAFF